MMPQTTAIFIITIFISLLSFGHNSYAGALPSPTPQTDTCAADILAGVHTRAWLEAQREEIQNKTIITKPDSVMEYSCFDSYLNALALHADTMFSENVSAWEGTVGRITSTSLDEDLQALVGASLSSYISTNFGHDYMGGRITGQNYTPGSISGAAYTCDAMNTVWMHAKCRDFCTGTQDGFKTFRQHVSTETRVYPADDCSTPDPRLATYEVALSAAGGASGAAPWKTANHSNMAAVAAQIAPYEGTGSCSSSPIIRTGITYGVQGVPRQDAICVRAGCYFDGAAGCDPI